MAYTCKLIRRCNVNYAASKAYFQAHKYSASVWSLLTAKDWMFAKEMEAATNNIANLSCLVSSCMAVFRRLAEKHLTSFKFQMMTIEAFGLKGKMRRSTHWPRQDGPSSNASTTAGTISKCDEAVDGVCTTGPRTKHAAKKIAAVGN
ncbi:hypothetical protein JG688_00015297, partial [Phytophthora aleatoria]